MQEGINIQTHINIRDVKGSTQCCLFDDSLCIAQDYIFPVMARKHLHLNHKLIWYEHKLYLVVYLYEIAPWIADMPYSNRIEILWFGIDAALILYFFFTLCTLAFVCVGFFLPLQPLNHPLSMKFFQHGRKNFIQLLITYLFFTEPSKLQKPLISLLNPTVLISPDVGLNINNQDTLLNIFQLFLRIKATLRLLLALVYGCDEHLNHTCLVLL